MTETPGMSMSGKMSVGIRAMVPPPRMTMSIDITTNVYGRFSAIRTSHIIGGLYFPPGERFGCRDRRYGYQKVRLGGREKKRVLRHGGGPVRRIVVHHGRCRSSGTRVTCRKPA